MITKPSVSRELLGEFLGLDRIREAKVIDLAVHTEIPPETQVRLELDLLGELISTSISDGGALTILGAHSIRQS